jgi:hypothetical protein
MPFVSEAQRRYLWMNHPKLAKKWAKKYGTPKNLPKHKRTKATGIGGLVADKWG